MKKLVFRSTLAFFVVTLVGMLGSSSATAGSYVFQNSGCQAGGALSQPWQFQITPANAHLRTWDRCDQFPYLIGHWAESVDSGFIYSGDLASISLDVGNGARFTQVNSLTYWLESRGGIEAHVRVEGGSSGSYPIATVANNDNDIGTVTNLSFPAGAQGPRISARLICTYGTCVFSGMPMSAIQTSPPTRLTIEDYTAPVATHLGGSLFSGGSVSGNRTVEPVAFDGNSGVRLVYGYVNGTIAYINASSCNSFLGDVNKLRPCPNPYSPGSVNLNTAQAPFHEGSNTINVCALDFATSGSPNVYCGDQRSVLVDN